MAVSLATALALALRLPALARRPMHTDEAVQAAKTGELLEHNFYRYDPKEFHGPTLYYSTLPVLWASGAHTFAESTEGHYRGVAVFFGTLLCALLLLFHDLIPWPGLGVSALLFALSPSMVFYSRYYIQEILLVCFTLAALGCFWRWLSSRSPIWAAMGGVALGLMYATKETCVISFTALALPTIALVLFAGWPKSSPLPGIAGRIPSLVAMTAFSPFRHALLAMCCALAVALVLFSSFFTNIFGPMESVLAFANYFSKGSGQSTHAKPFLYYAELIAWNRTPGMPLITESFTVALATLGAGTLLFEPRRGKALERATLFIAIYTIAVTLAYSWIAYKTPWCVLNIELGLVLLAGIGAVALLDLLNALAWKVAVTIVLAAGLAHLGWQSYLSSGRFENDPRNPYVYVQTTNDAVRLCERVIELSRIHPAGARMTVKVMAPESDVWPLPWYLRKLNGAGYWDAPPPDVDAPVVIASEKFAPELELAMRQKYQINAYGLRPGVLMYLYVEKDLWKRFLESRR